MKNLRDSMNKVLQGAIQSFARFPMAIISAVIISITAFVRIAIGWEIQETYSILLNSIQLAFLFGAVFSMAIVAYQETKTSTNSNYPKYLNVVGFLIPIATFILLYFFGTITHDGSTNLSIISVSRVLVATFVSAISFIYIISKAKTVDTFSDAFFISHKAFVISAIYGIVLMLGISGVLGAFQALLYNDLSYTVYQHVGVVVGFITYTIFLGYFPAFDEAEKTNEMKIVEEQSPFIIVLFANILVPIMLALSVVLLIWSVQVLFNGVDVSFSQLSSIASSYVIIGIWLHIMIAKHTSKIANFYKLVYPFSALLILLLEAFALVEQVGKVGIKTTEYSFAMLWIFAAISVFILIGLKLRPYRKIAITASVISVIWVLPIVGYQDLTFNSQVSRLEKILVNEQLLENDSIIKTDKEIKPIVMNNITDAVDFISYSEKKDVPVWFVKNLNDDIVFNNTFGFNKTYGINGDPTDYSWYNLVLETTVVDISDYNIALNTNLNMTIDIQAEFTNGSDNYDLNWMVESKKVPILTVKMNDNIIIEEDLEAYLNDLIVKYPKENTEFREVAYEDMNVIFENENLEILLVFNNIEIYDDGREEYTNYQFNINGLYIRYK